MIREETMNAAQSAAFALQSSNHSLFGKTMTFRGLAMTPLGHFRKLGNSPSRERQSG
jgi:hypothetical protein